MLVSLKEVIDLAEKGNFAIPAFNVYNVETIMGVIKAAEEERSPIIIQVYPRLMNEEVGYYISPAIVAAARKATVPVCFHLDHGANEKEVQKALRWGATGIMYDGSVHPFDENIENTKHIIEICDSVGVTVEGELGHVGSVNDEAMDEFTDPQEAAEFVKKTGVTCLAVLIGNAHGHYKKTPKLDIERVKAIREATDHEKLFVMMVDANYFKTINDTYGHDAGDEALVHIAKTLQNACEEGDYIARVGGDEFVIIGTRESEEMVEELGWSINNRLEDKSRKTGYLLSVSIGYEIYHYRTHKTGSELYKKADEKMYENKRQYHLTANRG